MEVVEQPKVHLHDAIRNVNALDEIPLVEDVPYIQAANPAVLHQVNYDTNFEDYEAFRSAQARFSEEARVHAQLNTLLEQGQEYAIMLYTWRSISRALPPIRNNEQPHRIEIYQKTVATLEPYALKLKNFMYFQKDAINRFCDEVRRLCRKDKTRTEDRNFISEAYLLTLGKMLKMFALLDEMKNMKASMKNDYSQYKRATQFLRHHDAETMQESQNLSIFLAQQSVIRDVLKQQLNEINGYEDLLSEVINTCVQMYETKLYLLPEEKHTLVTVMAFTLFLVDSSRMIEGKPVVVSINKIRKISLSKIDRIFKECEVVNLFGDMSLYPFNYVKKTPTYDASKWSECNSSRVSSQGVLLDHMPRFREEYTCLTAELAWHTNLTTTRENQRSPEENRELCDLALRGLQLLSGWSVQVLDTFTWKLAHCADDHQNPNCPKNAEDYEKATRYNYNSEEQFALIEVISMIKSVQAQLLRLETTYSEAIRRSIYRELQVFVQCHLEEPLRKAAKKRSVLVERLIVAVRATCLDQVQSGVETEVMSTVGSVSKKGGGAGTLSAAAIASASDSAVIAKRNVGPSSSQLYLVRTMLESMVDKGTGKHTLRKDINVNALAAIDTFHRTSFYWPYLLNFSETLFKCCDLSQLWYREFFLEMTNGERIQFPIEMSIPWILTNHILETQNPAFMEYLLYPMDLYNDAAFCALSRFRRQFLYDEIEAEVNLVFDQLVYKLSEQIFTHYKQYAGSILLDKQFRQEAQRLGWQERYPPPNRYAALLRQRHVQLLGRSVDLNRLISQRVHRALHQCLDTAISRFLSTDLTGIVELEALIECNRLCHRMLGEFIELDDFDAILREVNQSVTSPLGRIALHVFWELNYDLLRNYCYNDGTSRFVRTKLTFTEPLERDQPPAVAPQYVWGSKSLNSCYEAIFKLSTGFVGTPHFRTICRLLGYQGIYVVVAEVMKICQSVINQNLKEYCTKLARGMPRQLKQPHAAYGSDAIFSMYYAQLRNIYQYPDLRTNVCQTFRELGNIIIFCLQLEQNLTIEETTDLKHAAPFVGVIPKPFIPLPPPQEGKPARSAQEVRKEREVQLKEAMKKLEKRYQTLNIVNVVSRLGTPGQIALVKENETLTKERLCCGLVMFEQVLIRIRDYLDADTGPDGSSVWRGVQTQTEVIEIEGCTQFHRIWSAIQFIFCTPCGENEYTVEELFGEGLNWAGCALIVLLGQQKRFEALDIGYNLLRIQKMDGKDTTPEQISLEKMVTRIRRFHVLNSQIFATLNRYLHPGEKAGPQDETIRHFPPPTYLPS